MKFKFDYLIFGLLLFITLTIYMSCSHVNQQKKLNPSAGLKKKYEIWEETDVKTVCDIPGISSHSKHINNIFFTCLWQEKDSNGIFRSKVIFDSVKQSWIAISNRSENSELNSPENRLQKSLKSFEGAEFSLGIDANGKVIDMAGHENFKTAFDNLYNHDSSIKQEYLPYIFNKDYFIELFEKISFNLPNTPMEVGCSWSKKTPVTLSNVVQSSSTYKATDITGEETSIDISFAVDYPSIVQNKTSIVKGNGKGSLILDASSGVLLRSESSIITEQNIDVGGSIMTTTTSYHIKTSSKAL